MIISHCLFAELATINRIKLDKLKVIMKYFIEYVPKMHKLHTVHNNIFIRYY